MSESKEEVKLKAKKKYHPPRLMTHGSLKTITKSTEGSGMDQSIYQELPGGS